MEEEKGSGGGESSRPSSSFIKSGDRQVFAVDIRPGETTIVSWKKLVKDFNKVNNGTTAFEAPLSAPEPPVNAHPRLESRIAPVTGAPVQQSGDEAKDEPATNRFNAVIEKIERLYMGKDSSDDEDMNDNPDDDQYDTEDSFIDDAELDEYFEVDNTTVKHDGFFVNRGTLEHTETTVVPNQQPKKRRRKDLAKGDGENDDSRLPSKPSKLVKSACAKVTTAHPKVLSSATQLIVVSGVHSEDPKTRNQQNASTSGSKRKIHNAPKSDIDPSVQKVSNGDTFVALAEANDFADKKKSGVVLCKDPISKLRDEALSSNTSYQKYHNKSAHVQSRSHSSRSMGGGDDFESSIKSKEKNGKISHAHKKDGSIARPKGSLLERSIRELEKMVAESRPPSGEEADNTSQAIKRRLPRDIKMKLGKIAKLAQANHGKFSKELLTRLMSILGHIIQLRTLKRNLKLMLSTSASDNDNRFQLIKKEVIDMIKIKASSMELKALEQQTGASDDFQNTGTEEMEAPKRKLTMEPAMEDKICDLYDLYADGLEDDTAPQIRKLYTELSQLWPNGFMDNNGIKRAICRAKERRRALNNRNKEEQDKLKRKKMLAEEGVRTEGNSVSPAGQHGRDRLAVDCSGQNPACKQVLGTARTPSPLPAPRHEKMKPSSSNSHDESRVSVGDGALPKKKVKRKPEVDSDQARQRPEKLPSQLGEERPKPQIKQSTPPQRSGQRQQSATLLPSLEQSS